MISPQPYGTRKKPTKQQHQREGGLRQQGRKLRQERRDARLGVVRDLPEHRGRPLQCLCGPWEGPVAFSGRRNIGKLVLPTLIVNCDWQLRSSRRSHLSYNYDDVDGVEIKCMAAPRVVVNMRG